MRSGVGSGAPIRRWPCEKETVKENAGGVTQADWNATAASQGTPETATKPQKPRAAGTDSNKAPGRAGPSRSLGFVPGAFRIQTVSF